MKIEEAFIIKVFMNGEGHCMTNSENGTEGIGPWTEIGNFPQEFH